MENQIENNDLINTYKNLFKDSEKRAKYFYYKNKELFLSNNYDFDDLKQDINVVILKTINKYKDQNKSVEDIIKLSGKAISWIFDDIQKKFINNYKYFNKNISVDYDIIEKFENGLESNKINKLSIPVDYIDLSDNIIKYKFEELHIVLNDREYNIIKSYFKTGKTFKAISIEQKCSIQRVRNIFFKALKKCSSYLGIKEYK